MIAVLDIDGVLADFVLGFTTLAHEMYGTPIYSTKEQQAWEKFEDLDGKQTNAVWDAVNQSRHFWYNLPPLATEAELRNLGALTHNHDLYFVTSRHARPGVLTQTRNWLNRYEIWNAQIALTPHKGDFARLVRADVLIEDRPNNAIAATRWAKRVYLMDQPYNRWVNDFEAGVHRVHTLTEFIEEAAQR